MTPEQVRQARQKLGWTTERLGAYSNLPASVIRAYEQSGVVRPPKSLLVTDRISAIRRALEEAGFTFEPETGQLGVASIGAGNLGAGP